VGGVWEDGVLVGGIVGIVSHAAEEIGGKGSREGGCGRGK